ncbi:hypothetical protein BsWGS_03429 [Bradybaena similaris]
MQIMSPCLRSNQLADMLVTWLVVFLCAEFVSSASLMGGLMKRQDENRDSCDVNGRTYPHGAVITAPEYNNCIKQTCRDGFMHTVQEGCRDIWTPGVCHPWGNIIVYACATYICDQTNYLENISEECPDIWTPGVCHPRGSVVTHACSTYTCDQSNTLVRTSEGCLDIRTSPRVCRPRGSFFTHACSTYTCDESNSVVKTRGLCQDNVGACHEPGTRFTRWILRTLYTNCTCEIEDDYLTYSCYLPS